MRNQVLVVPMMSHLFNPKLIVAVILTLSFMVDESLSKRVLLETVPQSLLKREEAFQTMVELSEQEEAFQTMVELSEQEEAFQTMEEKP